MTSLSRVVRTCQVATLVLATGVLTACGGGDDGSGEGSAASSGDAIVFGLATPRSGPVAPVGEQEILGAQLAVEQLNADGGVLDRQVELAIEDHGCNPTEAVTAANQLVEQEVDVMFGFLCSSATLAAMPIVERAEIPLINGISTSPDIPAQSGAGGNDWVFTLTPSDSTFATALGRYLTEEHDVSSIAIVAEDTDYGRGGAESLEQTAKEMGIRTVSTDYFAQGTQDFSPLLARIKSDGPERVALWALGADDANFSRQFAAAFDGSDTLLTGRPELVGPLTEIVETGRLDAATAILQYLWTVDTTANKAFVKAFRAKNDAPPIVQSFEGYQEIMLAARAIEDAGSTDPAAIRDALKNGTFPSMLEEDGTLEFDDNHQAHDKATILSVEGDKVVLAAIVST